MKKLKIFPWDKGVKPYWTNPENGYEWYIDKLCTEWCTKYTPNDLPKLNAVVFLVVQVVEGERTPLDYVAIDKETNKALFSSTSLEGIGSKIDFYRLGLHSEEIDNQ